MNDDTGVIEYEITGFDRLLADVIRECIREHKDSLNETGRPPQYHLAA